MCWEQLNILLNCGEEKHAAQIFTAKQPAILPISHMSVTFTLWDAAVPGKNTPLYCLSNLNLMSRKKNEKKSPQYKMQNTFMFNPLCLLSGVFRTSSPDVGKGVLHFQTQKRCSVCVTELGRLIVRWDNALLGKQPLPSDASPALQFNHTKSKYMNSCSWTLIKDAHHTAPSLEWGICSFGSESNDHHSYCQLSLPGGVFSYTYLRFRRKERQLYLIIPGERFALKNHVRVIDCSCKTRENAPDMITSLSGTSDIAAFHGFILCDEITSFSK